MNMKSCEIVSDIEHLNEDTIINVVNRECIRKYLYILHDKDVYTVEDEQKNSLHKAGELKYKHYHIYLQFKENCPQDSKYISMWFGLSENFVGRIKGRFTDALKYAIHVNRPNKYQYEPSECFANFDFMKTIEKANNLNRLDEIIQQIDMGIIRRYNYTEHITTMEYVQYKTKIDTAFKYREDRIKGADRRMDVIYITGESGSGKTTYAKQICKDKKLSFYVSSGSNDVLDGYQSQDCIILDDLRPSCLGLSDLLKMLDNNTSSTVKSRYYNKTLECQLIIITSILPIDSFFNKVFENESEPIVQLKRRCSTYIKMNDKVMEIYCYNDVKRDYDHVVNADNPIKDMYKTKVITHDMQVEKVQSLLGTLVIAKDYKDNDSDDKYMQEELPFK